MASPIITSLDILNLSHALKDICEVNCKTSECLNDTLKFLLQYNLIKLNLIFEQQLDCETPENNKLLRNIKEK